MITPLALASLLTCLAATPVADGPPELEVSTAVPADGSRLLVIGDSITQAGDYVVYVEAYLLTRFPDRTITIINHGLSSETAAGTSEPDHPSVRPWIHDRFDRDVTAWEPDIVVACYGMNDGIYHPFDPKRFQAYQDGILRLITRTREATSARIDLLTPPPYDPYQRQVSDPDAEQFGYRYPFLNYDQVLAHYSSWLCTIAAPDVIVADVNSRIAEHVQQRRTDRVSYSLMPDGVHPNPTGHWLIAQTLLKTWGVPETVSEVHVEANPLQSAVGQVKDLSQENGSISFTWRSSLPMPIDPRCDLDSIQLERVTELLNRYRFTLTGLKPGRYRFLASETPADEPVVLGTFSDEELAEGIDLNLVPGFPTVKASQEVLSELMVHRSEQARAWRESIKDGTPPNIPPPGEDLEVMQHIRAKCQPRDLRIRIEPVEVTGP